MIKPRNAIVAQQRIYVRVYIYIQVSWRGRREFDRVPATTECVPRRWLVFTGARSIGRLLACLPARSLARSPAHPPALSSARLASFLVQAQAGGHLKEWRRHAAPHYARYWFFRDCARGPPRRARQHAPRAMSHHTGGGLRLVTVTWVPKTYVCTCVHTRMLYTWTAYIYAQMIWLRSQSVPGGDPNEA